MGIQRYFLGWDGPMLPAAARWLSGRFVQGQAWDLSQVTVVTPGRRALRRLLELLVEAADEAGVTLFPPKLVTLGGLPELLCDIDEPVAGSLPAALARIAALRTASAETLSTLVTEPPETDDLVGWWTLAAELQSVGDDLASAGLRVADVPQRAAETGFDLRHLDRFEALASLDQAYQATLAAAGLTDRQEIRLRAVEGRRCGCDGEIVLVAAADLSPLLQRMLRLAGEVMSVTALVHAPPLHGNGFDELGGLRVAYWRDQRVELPDDAIHFVDRPTDQAKEAVRAIADQAQAADGLTADQVTVGLGDEAMAGTVLRALAMADVPARFGPGQALLKSRPATLLAALGRFAGERRLDDFAELLRHPDLEDYVAVQGSSARGRRGGRGAGGDVSEAAGRWLTLLDDYATQHLQARLDGAWLGSSQQQAALKTVWDAVHALLPIECAQTRPLHRWSEPILEALRLVYGQQTLGRHDPDDHALSDSLSQIADVLREQAHTDTQAFATPAVTVAQAIAVTLARLEGARVVEMDGRAAVELVGYLELQLDDAPHLIVTAMNEGAVPGSPHVDPLLPDSLRSKLGLADNARRYARDLMMLCAIVNSRPNVTLIAGRRSAEGDPLAPSRLLLACDDDTMVRRVNAFYHEDAHDQGKAGTLLTAGQRDRFLIPPPLMDEPVLDRLSVTAFRDYLACPYRFYLQHVRQLGGIDDTAVEMNALVFGNLAHHVLQLFGESDCSESTRAEEVAAFLSETLDRTAAERFGGMDRSAVRVQIEQLRERLVAFSTHQARLAEQGWRIVRGRIENRLEVAIDVDGEPFTIVGRVDRIDHHPVHGYRILDYKTAGTGQRPDKTHRGRVEGELQWIDLQLPLYRDLCAPLGVCGQVEVGYLNLPKKLAETGLAVAEWSDRDFDEAMAERDRIIRAVRDRAFWPPKKPPAYADDFTGLCADLSLDRTDLIAASTGDAP